MLGQRAQRAADSSGFNFSSETFKVKDECNEATLAFTKQVQSLISRLEGMSEDCKQEITRKANELLSVKNEMDQYDPAKRIPISLKSYTSKSFM